MHNATRLNGELIELLLDGPPDDGRRQQLGELLLAIFDADIYVSYVSDENGPYAQPVAVNTPPETLAAYDDHFRHIDWLTPQLRREQRALAITFPGRDRDEFVQDFLRRRDMYYGMNYFARAPRPGTVDFRLWRHPDRDEFQDEDVLHLQRIGDLVQRLWPVVPDSGIELTPRELDVVRLLAQGFADKEICQNLKMAPSTVRTHMRNIFRKTASPNRSSAANWYHSTFSA